MDLLNEKSQEVETYLRGFFTYYQDDWNQRLFLA